MLHTCLWIQMARLLGVFFPQLATFTRSSALCSSQILWPKTLFTNSLLKRTMAYSICESGASNTLDFRMYFCKYRRSYFSLITHIECSQSISHGSIPIKNYRRFNFISFPSHLIYKTIIQKILMSKIYYGISL